MKLEGIFVPILTPFDKDGEIEEEALRGMIDYLLGVGISGIVPCGSTGESPYLSREEMRRVIEVVVDQVDGKAPVIAGAGTMGTRDTILQARDALEAGADAALVVTPYYFKLSNEEVFRHYAALLEAVDLSILIYNVPKFTNYSIPPGLIERLVLEYSGVVGVKDSSGDIGLVAEILRLVGGKVSVLTGSGDTILPTLMLGGSGAIVAIGNVIPEVCIDLYKAFREGRIAEAAKHQMTASFVNKVLIKDHSQIAR
jgi:4-hydroxy-tetrahydrodipicolinate synthase